jgi:hypothetical protein
MATGEITRGRLARSRWRALGTACRDLASEKEVRAPEAVGAYSPFGSNTSMNSLATADIDAVSLGIDEDVVRVSVSFQ